MILKWENTTTVSECFIYMNKYIYIFIEILFANNKTIRDLLP